MKKTVFIVLISVLSVSLIGCGKKEPSLEEMQEPLSMEALSSLNSTSGIVVDPKAGDSKGLPAAQSVQPEIPAQELQSLPPAGPYQPTAVQIQTALRNAGYYTGPVDGKVGPMTKKAIEDFQKASGLEADGKVGTKTWAILGGYLNPVPAQPPTGKKKR